MRSTAGGSDAVILADALADALADDLADDPTDILAYACRRAHADTR